MIEDIRKSTDQEGFLLHSTLGMSGSVMRVRPARCFMRSAINDKMDRRGHENASSTFASQSLNRNNMSYITPSGGTQPYG
ncbi:hypothetical protein GCM10007854_01160 [Algimonas porphyrae]|uniref:Uncharacterized protein n=1 Tax=Algimonas porphyrae TaxID=1128113 RepID=A0ABQ5UXR9_9PROT|nr:hypothetical protein GCM10007854_01160 [Algimonas porphyrae]